MTALPWNTVEWITFDCYGTLIDWESGILAALNPVLARHDIYLPENTLLERYGHWESQVQTGPYQPYKAVLQTVMERLADEWGLKLEAKERDALWQSIPQWQPFSDTPAALMQLATQAKLVILSNIDDDLLAETLKHLPSCFVRCITAQQVGHYKPNTAHFERFLSTTPGASPQNVLHVAQSLYHDIVPAITLNLQTVWINRRHGQTGAGATRAAEATPNWTFPDLKSLAATLTNPVNA